MSKPSNLSTLAETRPLLSSIIGSHATGANHPNSDIDRVDVVVADPRLFLGINLPHKGHLVSEHTGPDQDVDISTMEILHFLQGLTGNSFKALEALFSDQALSRSTDGDVLFENRHRFLSRQLSRPFQGMAQHSAQQAIRRPHENNNEQGALKSARRIYHLATRFEQIWCTGDLSVRMSPGELEEFWAVGLDDVEPLLHRLNQVTKQPTRLPEHPDIEWANAWLTQLRVGGL